MEKETPAAIVMSSDADSISRRRSSIAPPPTATIAAERVPEVLDGNTKRVIIQETPVAQFDWQEKDEVSSPGWQTYSGAVTPVGFQTPSGAQTPAGWQTPSGAQTPGWATPGLPSGAQTPGASSLRALNVEAAYPDIGTIYSWRGAFILLITCGSQLMDNIFMSGVNLSLPSIQKDFDVLSGNLQWLISAYTLTFGGFLLFSGVLSDRYGRKNVFSIGMVWLSIWTLACGFGTSFIQIAIFRALQGIGAAMTVPSSIGIISTHFVASERNKALSVFAASGAVGFCSGLIFGGFVTQSLGWKYVFRIAVAVTGPLGIFGFILLPKDRKEGTARPKLDFIGAGLSTAGLILLSFVLSSGGVYGWNKAFIIVLLILSVAMLVVFTWVEKKVDNPIMPLSLWKLKNFAALWVSGFIVYGGYQAVIYYTVLQAQEVLKLSAGQTAIRFLPLGAAGFLFSISTGSLMGKVDGKWILLAGLGVSAIAPIPACLLTEDDPSFWRYILPTTLLVVTGVTLCWVSITTILVGSVPVNVKSLCGGLVNTAFQIGSGVILALTAAVVDAVDVKKGHSEAKQYATGMWCCVGLCGLGFIVTLFTVKSTPTKDEDNLEYMH